MVKFRFPKRFLTLGIVGSILILSAIGAKLNILEIIKDVFQDGTLQRENQVSEYVITADFDPEEKILTANEKIIYVNKGNKKLNTLYFHLYPNAFKMQDSTPFEKAEMDQAYPYGFEPGSIQVDAVKNNHEILNYIIMGTGDSILRVNLDQDLEPGERIELAIDFIVKLPPCCSRFGYGEHTMNIANWYPIISVFDENGWNLEPYYTFGDPFYSDIADYRIILSMPPAYQVASSGDLLKKENINGKIYWTLEGKRIRDFAIVVSNQFKIINDEVNDIKIYAYYFEDKMADISLETAKDAIKIFSDLYGKYPYKQFTVTASDFFSGGMEYPNIALIDQSLYKEESKDILEYMIVHETAHQWWYGMVGNNQILEPWLDEALAEYSTLLYYEKKYGAQVKNQLFEKRIVKNYERYKRSGQSENNAIYRSINQFKDVQEYQALVYCKGAMFLQDLRKQLGDEIFFKMMQVYFDKYKYKNANTEDFIKVCEQVSNKDLSTSFKKWLQYYKE